MKPHTARSLLLPCGPGSATSVGSASKRQVSSGDSRNAVGLGGICDSLSSSPGRGRNVTACAARSSGRRITGSGHRMHMQGFSLDLSDPGFAVWMTRTDLDLLDIGIHGAPILGRVCELVKVPIGDVRSKQ